VWLQDCESAHVSDISAKLLFDRHDIVTSLGTVSAAA
jgi:hypothetical protein